MSFLNINNDCILCGRCVDICPRYIFQIDKAKSKKVMINENIQYCHDCGHCIAICPKDAIINTRMGDNLEVDFPLVPSSIDYEKALSFIRIRRSIRKFKSEPISEEKIKQLLEFGRFAPTGHNTNAVEYTIVVGRNKVDLLWKETVQLMKEVICKINNPFWVAMAYLLGKKNFIKEAKKNEYRLKSHITNFENKRDTIFHGAPMLILLHAGKKAASPIEDCAIASENIMLGASTLGLGATIIGYFIRAWKYSKKIKRLVNLPENHILYSCLSVGIPAYNFRRLVPRPEPKISFI
ncbi:MAG: nitroreductase family protein [Candidatus Heimdallarchaeum endolithica]|uniref:Nitroreductase family protein n=1 Tax=Candidatus Heimdallarchaeum endolithica TaxID=2876572 RepID=A0A9Y1FMG9_9ARCH|nr:MAG: nitroreductase family protein [Candidatus Heimdallarchaeum endolithica]